jgi:hypothetical protein
LKFLTQKFLFPVEFSVILFDKCLSFTLVVMSAEKTL